VQDVVAPLFEWAYGIWPSYGPAVALASLVISAFHAPFAVLEVRRQWKVLAQADPAELRDPDLRVFAHSELFTGRHLLLLLARRALLLGSAILVLETVIGWEQRRGAMTFAGIDLLRSVFTLATTGHRDWLVITHSVIPVVLVLVYAVAGTKPVGGSRTMHLVGAALIALVVPGAVVLYLLTVLLVNAGVVRMARAAALARSKGPRDELSGSIKIDGSSTVAPLSEAAAELYSEGRNDRVRATRWADYPLPTDRLQHGIRAFWGGWLGCLLAAVATVVGEWYVLSALPDDLRDLSRGVDIEPPLAGSLLGIAGLYVFARGEQLRWMGQVMLSRISAYRHEHGLRQRTESVAALNRSLPRRARRTGIGLMTLGGLGACGLGCTGITIGLRYTWELVVGEGASLSVSVVPLVLGIVLMTQGNALLRVGGRHVQRIISSPKDLVAGSYALYLRSFEEDPQMARLHRISRPSALLRGYFTAGNPEEERLADALTWAGLPVGVGQPGQRVPHVGIPRMYLPLHGWEEPVREMMRGASLVVLVLGHGTGTLWELGEAMRILPPQRLVLLVTMARDEYDRCREVVNAELWKQATMVRRETGAHWKPPSLPDYTEGPVVASRIRGLIYFTPAWDAVFVRLERPPLLENQLMGALDRSMWPAAVQLTEYELRTGKNYG
jgi:hypothetical protein